MIGRVLIANRGEIAVRILRACRSLGVEAVVAHSEADRQSRAVLMADESICIGPAESARSYLSAATVISAAVVSGCDAIHPGYGFLSEDEAFAEMTRAHDLVFIGPSADVLERFASKAGTRELLARHGLPMVPGSEGMLRDDDHALAEAERIGYPVLVKPSAGGGGKGMRMVRTPRELQQALTVCRSEARAAFGDDSLYLEKWLERTRHVEVQVIIDNYGHGVHVGERDCSVQRRHQKIVEEDRARGYIRAEKAVTASEWFFGGHFPGLPVMPGVIQVEALAQTMAVYVAREEGFGDRIGLFAGIDECRFKRVVQPGDRLTLEVTMEKLGRRFGRGRAVASVDGEVCCEALISFVIPPADVLR